MLKPKDPCVVSPVATAHIVTNNMTNVTTSTINMIGLRNITRGFNLTNDCFKLSITSSFGNKEAALLFLIFLICQLVNTKIFSDRA